MGARYDQKLGQARQCLHSKAQRRAGLVLYFMIPQSKQQCTLWVKKTGPFLFEHNFGKYCPILIILSPLQTEINCDNVYHKIYHHTWNLLVDVPCKMDKNILANVAGMIS